MKKEEKNRPKKMEYSKPLLIKHKKLREITAVIVSKN